MNAEVCLVTRKFAKLRKKMITPEKRTRSQKALFMMVWQASLSNGIVLHYYCARYDTRLHAIHHTILVMAIL